MQTDQPSTSGQHGDVSPINGTMSNLPEDGKTKRKEPMSESLSNFSRVTPSQFAYIVLPPGSRYQPVRPVSTKAAPPSAKGKTIKTSSATFTSKYAGGGGILMLQDLKPDEPAEFIDLQPPVQLPAPPEPVTLPAAGAPRSGVATFLESGPEAAPPQPFEVRSRSCDPNVIG